MQRRWNNDDDDDGRSLWFDVRVTLFVYFPPDDVALLAGGLNMVLSLGSECWF